MPTSAPITYRDFWDVPRIFLVTHEGRTLLFDCPFDEATEDYPDTYAVYQLPALADGELTGSWDKLSERAERYLGTVPVGEVRFDPTRRQGIDPAVLRELLTEPSHR
jgi:hypothetical protein